MLKSEAVERNKVKEDVDERSCQELGRERERGRESVCVWFVLSRIELTLYS